MSSKKKEPEIRQRLFEFEIKGQISASSSEEAGDILWDLVYAKTRGLLLIHVVS